MFSALKKLTKSGDDRCPAPMPMSSSLQKKFSRGVHFNSKYHENMTALTRYKYVQLEN